MATREQKKIHKFIWYLVAGALLILGLGAGYRTLLFWGARWGKDFFYPYLTVYSLGRDFLSDQSLLLYSKRELADKLEDIQAQNRILAAQAALLQDINQQNAQLRQLLNLSKNPEWKYLHGEIIQRDPVDWLQSFTISLGLNDGLQPGAAVFSVTTQGTAVLVGIVHELSKHSARVVSVLNPGLKISARLTGADSVGLTNPSDMKITGNYLPVGFLPSQKNYTIEEGVFTTGFEANIPPGLKIGNLASLDRGDSIFSNQLYASGTITPAADLNRLRFIVVALRK